MRIESSQIELDRKTNKLEEEKSKQNPSQNVIKSLAKGIKENNSLEESGILNLRYWLAVSVLGLLLIFALNAGLIVNYLYKINKSSS